MSPCSARGTLLDQLGTELPALLDLVRQCHGHGHQPPVHLTTAGSGAVPVAAGGGGGLAPIGNADEAAGGLSMVEEDGEELEVTCPDGCGAGDLLTIVSPRTGER